MSKSIGAKAATVPGNWQRYDLGGAQKLSFEEGVDSYVPYAGTLKENVTLTLYKVKSTMCNCRCNSRFLSCSECPADPGFRDPRLIEGGAHDSHCQRQVLDEISFSLTLSERSETSGLFLKGEGDQDKLAKFKSW